MNENNVCLNGFLIDSKVVKTLCSAKICKERLSQLLKIDWFLLGKKQRLTQFFTENAVNNSELKPLLPKKWSKYFPLFSVFLRKNDSSMKVRYLFSKMLLMLIVVMLQCSTLFAQSNTADNGMANLMYSSGKIYVVIGVILLIFIGIVFYLVALDRRIGKMEDEL